LAASVIADSLAKRLFLYLVAHFSIAPLAVAGQGNTIKSGSWSGTLVSSTYNADEAAYGLLAGTRGNGS
jgi:hypothetical protein